MYRRRFYISRKTMLQIVHRRNNKRGNPRSKNFLRKINYNGTFVIRTNRNKGSVALRKNQRLKNLTVQTINRTTNRIKIITVRSVAKYSMPSAVSPYL